jgi:hypothetical protein
LSSKASNRRFTIVGDPAAAHAAGASYLPELRMPKDALAFV